LSSSITGTATFYAGGGGGNLGSGGDGTGASNTGGGGNADGGFGNNGVVIIRYADSYPAATATTGSPTITVSGGYRIYKWTGSGSITF
jgi:hypothetical protein